MLLLLYRPAKLVSGSSGFCLFFLKYWIDFGKTAKSLFEFISTVQVFRFLQKNVVGSLEWITWKHCMRKQDLFSISIIVGLLLFLSLLIFFSSSSVFVCTMHKCSFVVLCSYQIVFLRTVSFLLVCFSTCGLNFVCNYRKRRKVIFLVLYFFCLSDIN